MNHGNDSSGTVAQQYRKAVRHEYGADSTWMPAEGGIGGGWGFISKLIHAKGCGPMYLFQPVGFVRQKSPQLGAVPSNGQRIVAYMVTEVEAGKM